MMQSRKEIGMLTHTSNKTCGRCAVLDKSTGICALTGHRKEPEEYCSSWTDNVQTCDMCGGQFIGLGTLIEIDGKYKQLCPSCDNGVGGCRTCVNKTQGYCKFCDQSYRPDVPPVIVKSIQKGPAIMQAQVENPEREKITCQQGCLCYKEEYGCCRHSNTCGNYKIRL